MTNLETDVAALYCSDRDGKLFQKWQSGEIPFYVYLAWKPCKYIMDVILMRMTVNDSIRKLDAYIFGEVNTTMERYKFNTINQRKYESIYVPSLKMIVKSRNFFDCISLKDSLIRDRLVLGIYMIETRKHD